MTNTEQKAAAKKFAEDWEGQGYEKGMSQPFWLSLLSKVLGIEEPEKFISFEEQVHLDNTSFIDGYIDATKVMIEQKGLNKDLRKPIKQSDGSLLTPFQQAKRYVTELPVSKHPRWIVTCNFAEFNIYDMEKPHGEPEVIMLKDLGKEYYRLQFLVDVADDNVRHEETISLKAGEIVGLLYDKILAQYNNPESEETLKSLNKLCVRLVFCLYAEDAGLFDKHNSFHNYIKNIADKDIKGVRKGLIELFNVLNTKTKDRDPYMDDDLKQFPYVNGGLFDGEDIEIPRFTEEIVHILLEDASANFDWSEISPTIFGAVFESTLNPDTRRHGGMHYTSVKDIHKVIDPLFLEDLQSEFEDLKNMNTRRVDGSINPIPYAKKEEYLNKFQNKLSSLKFFDPACGSGNFLTETYLSIRRLENAVIKEQYEYKKDSYEGQMTFMSGNYSPIKVSINQFYGVEINDFAVTVAQTALWIAENQMIEETKSIIHSDIEFLPLKTKAHITEGNALKLDWSSIIPVYELSYIMGNPPFVGGMYMSESQKAEIRKLYSDVKGAGEFDYVTGWYKKAVEYTLGTNVRTAFVSTNSICQGSQVITFWKYLINRYSIHIDFAYQTFVWNNDTKTQNQARVHCVIVGFSGVAVNVPKRLYSDDKIYKICDQISPYLTDTSVIFIDSRSKPICNVPAMRFGSMPRDGGGFVLSPEERAQLIKSEPLAEKWIRPYIGAVEFLNNKERYCLWLVGAEPSEIAKCPTVKKRVEYVRETRAASKAEGTRKFAATPTLFCQIAQPDSDYIIVPKTSSGKRSYIPLGFMDKNTIASDLVFLIPNAGLYEFGVLMSNVHNAWMKQVAGRLKSDYRYAKDIVYNNFIWCEPTPEQKAKIEQTAQGILDARALYPKSTLANLYDNDLMPPELRKAHIANDRAVMQAYGFPIKNFSRSDCVAELMKLYQKKVGD